MTMRTPVTGAPADPDMEFRRSEVVRLLDVVFPEVRVVLSDKQVRDALALVETWELQFRGGDRSRVFAGPGPAHFMLAGRLWQQNWEALLPVAVRNKLGEADQVSAEQIFAVAGKVDPPKPNFEFDPFCWMDFVNAVARELAPIFKREDEAQSALDVKARKAALQAKQDAFAEDFRRRLTERLPGGTE